jgi:hypothetical protein
MDKTRHDDLAQRLSLAALQQWKEGFQGLIALPAAAALSTAATAMFMASVVQRAFEMIDHTIVNIGHKVGDESERRFDGRTTSEARPS